MANWTIAQANSPPRLLLISEIMTESTRKLTKCCVVSESLNFQRIKGRSVPVSRLGAGKSTAFFVTAETELVNYVKSGDPMVKMCGVGNSRGLYVFLNGYWWWLDTATVNYSFSLKSLWRCLIVITTAAICGNCECEGRWRCCENYIAPHETSTCLFRVFQCKERKI